MDHERRLSARLVGVAWIYISLSLLLGWLVPRITQGPLGWFNPVLGPNQVVAFLSAVATGMMTFTGIVFSLLFVLMQFGSSAYSPHLVMTLARNPVLAQSQGVFTGTFLYSLMALRGVGRVDGHGTTALTLWVALIWLIASVYLLVRLSVVFAQLNIADVLEMLGDAERKIRRAYGARWSVAQPRAALSTPATSVALTQSLTYDGLPRYVLRIDAQRLVALARAADAVIRLPIAIGDPVTWGTTLALVEGAHRPVAERHILECIVMGRDQSLEAGPRHAMRMLVDIGIRALSPAINDPTTAVRSLDQIEDLLVRLGNSRLDNGEVADDAGIVRLEYAATTWEEYLELGVTEIQQYGATSVQVERRLAALLATLRERVPVARQPAVEALAQERDAMVGAVFGPGAPQNRAKRLDRQGLGHTMLRA